MDTNGALGTIGVLVCVGAIVLIALLAFAFRALSAGRRQASGMGTNRGPEQPRYDDPDIQSQGGFGGVPNTGMDRDTDFNRRSTTGTGGFGGAQTYDQDRSRKRQEDDDDVRSSGGFGAG